MNIELQYRLGRMNRYYQLTKFYTFLKDLAVKTLFSLVFFFLSVYVLDRFIIDLDSMLSHLLASFSTPVIYVTFFISESILGLIPPELFIALTSKASNPWLDLFIIASLSYFGGVVSYLIGMQVYKIPKVRIYIEKKVATHIKNVKQWGGFLIVLGAMLPIPHSLVSMSCGIIRFKFSHYLLWALFRFLRFFVYGITIFSVL